MKLLEPYKTIEDQRGRFFGIVNSGQWEEINCVETVAGQVRGGHYHKETRELFYIIDGDIDITITELNGTVVSHFTVGAGSVFVIEPYEIHTFLCKSACRWINVLSKRIDDQFHDIHLPQPLPGNKML
jgi:mannose-6-phosphate isomerase-like protein (cupin superfamily)